MMMARKRKAEGAVDAHEDEVDGGREASRNTTRREEQAAIARR